MVCGIPIKKQGMIVLLQSITDTNKAGNAVSTITAHYLNRDRGLDILIGKFDNAFKTEIVEGTYSIQLKIKQTTNHNNFLYI